jgi:hypothetical protein
MNREQAAEIQRHLISAETLAARLQALHESDRVECMGEPHKWRHSEVRLKR